MEAPGTSPLAPSPGHDEYPPPSPLSACESEVTVAVPAARKRIPARSFQRLKRFGYDAIELIPPRGRYGMRVSMDLRAVMRALHRTGYSGYCTIECAPTIPDPDTAARDGIEHLKWCDRVAAFQLSEAFPNGFAVNRQAAPVPALKPVTSHSITNEQ